MGKSWEKMEHLINKFYAFIFYFHNDADDVDVAAAHDDQPHTKK